MGGNSFRAFQSLAAALYEGPGEVFTSSRWSRGQTVALTIAAGAIPIIAGIVIVSAARHGAGVMRSTPPGGTRSVAASDRNTVPDRGLSAVNTGTGGASETPVRDVHEPGLVARRDGQGRAPANAIPTHESAGSLSEAKRESMDADEALRRARYELQQKAAENAALRRQLASLTDELGTSRNRAGTLAQELEQKIADLRSRDLDVQRSLSMLREAEQERERETALRSEAESKSEKFQTSLADTHLLYAPMTPARIEYRRERLSERHLAVRAGAPFGALWDGLGDVFVGIAEAVGGPAGEARYVAILAGGGEVIIDEETARRWERLGVRIDNRIDQKSSATR